MYDIHVIESAKELLDCARSERAEGDDTPYCGGLTLVFENNMSHVELQGDDNFILDQDVTPTDIITELARRANLKVHIT